MKRVSIIVPCYNEEKFIGFVLESLIKQDYPAASMEVFFVDGNSTDDTRKIIQGYAGKYNWIKLLTNIHKYVPHAMNLGISQATGEIIMRLDGHASYPEFYISRLVSWLDKLNADNVGGTWVTKPGSGTLTALVISRVLSHPFGVGNSYFRTGVSEPREVDTVPFGCYRKEAFDKAGLYNLNLIRDQDIELNKRLKLAGGKIFLVPDVHSVYYSRDQFSRMARNNYENGQWAILTAYYTKTFGSLSVRHFVPLMFVLYVLALPVILVPPLFVMPYALPSVKLLSLLLVMPLLLHALMNAWFSFKIALQENQILLFPLLWYSFFLLHISYGIGSIAGVLKVIFKRKL